MDGGRHQFFLNSETCLIIWCENFLCILFMVLLYVWIFSGKIPCIQILKYLISNLTLSYFSELSQFLFKINMQITELDNFKY